MVKESFTGSSNEVEESIVELIRTMQSSYGEYYEDLNPEDQILWNELLRFASEEKGQSIEKRQVLIESLTSFLSFLESEYEKRK